MLIESSMLRKESELHGPRTELEYWKGRRDTFGFLIYQFHQENNRRILEKALELSSELKEVTFAKQKFRLELIINNIQVIVDNK